MSDFPIYVLSTESVVVGFVPSVIGAFGRGLDGELDLRVLAALHRLFSFRWFKPEDRAVPLFVQLGKARKRGKASDAKAPAGSPLPLNALCGCGPGDFLAAHRLHVRSPRHECEFARLLHEGVSA
jgi:hypothetical protein